MKVKNITNPIFKDLKNHRLINIKNLVEFNDKTRDKKIKSYKDIKTGVIFLKDYKRGLKYYTSKKTNRTFKKNLSYSNFTINKKILKTSNLNDDLRRYNQFKTIIKNKIVLDYGCGKGNFLKYSKNSVKKIYGVEVNKKLLINLSKKYNVQDSLDKFNNLSFDVITCFHVLEHLPNQIFLLKMLLKKLKKKGTLIIEVPSAHDKLLTVSNLKEFRDFTMWSEHLILHTSQSLKKFIKLAGGKKINIKFYQRYNLANHFGWLIDRLPGGHDFNNIPNNLNRLYQNYLSKIKKTDTLIAIIKK